MIKIIKAGTRKEAECEKCGAVLSYEKCDVKTETKTNTLTSFKQYITCPQCGNEIILKQSR